MGGVGTAHWSAGCRDISVLSRAETLPFGSGAGGPLTPGRRPPDWLGVGVFERPPANQEGVFTMPDCKPGNGSFFPGLASGRRARAGQKRVTGLCLHLPGVRLSCSPRRTQCPICPHTDHGDPHTCEPGTPGREESLARSNSSRDRALFFKGTSPPPPRRHICRLGTQCISKGTAELGGV